MTARNNVCLKHYIATPHFINGFCQCRCNECYLPLLGSCCCLGCICDINGISSEDERHNELAQREETRRIVPGTAGTTGRQGRE